MSSLSSKAPSTDTYDELFSSFAWSVPKELNIGLACSDDQDPAAIAVVDLGDGDARREATYGDLADWSSQFAHAVRAAGLERGDRVAVVLPQGIELLVAHLGTYKAGMVVVPLTTLFGVDALAYRIGDSGARLVVTDASHEPAVLDAVGDSVRVIVVDAEDGPDLWAVLESHDSAAPSVVTSRDEPALMIYTSGTTGAAKGALHGHRVLYGHLPGFELAFNDYPALDAPVSWTPADWAWIGGLYDLAMPTLFHGGTLVASRRKGFDPAQAVQLMVRERVTSTFLPPTALRMVAQRVSERPAGLALTAIITGGESLDPRTAAWGTDVLGVRINEMYGQTEANFLAGNSHHWPVDQGYFGRPYPGHQLLVVDPDGHEVASGEEGEIALRADDPVVMLGYWNRPDATAHKIRSGLLYTGDRGVRADSGALRFVARADDVINSAGFRIGPSEIENCLLQHVAVQDVAVIGVPDEVRGERVKAFIVVSDRAVDLAALQAELTSLVRSRLGNYQYPREYEFIDEIPKTTTGKLRRNELRARSKA